MRILVLTFLLTAGATARIAAQQATTTPPPRQETDEPRGFLPEPAIVGRAVDLGSRLVGVAAAIDHSLRPVTPIASPVLSIGKRAR